MLFGSLSSWTKNSAVTLPGAVAVKVDTKVGPVPKLEGENVPFAPYVLYLQVPSHQLIAPAA
jgi:hypothetical protein